MACYGVKYCSCRSSPIERSVRQANLRVWDELRDSRFHGLRCLFIFWLGGGVFAFYPAQDTGLWFSRSFRSSAISLP